MKSILLSETIADNRKDSDVHQPEEEHTQYYLPNELLEKILSKLTLKDNIRASAVSKRFLAIAKSVRKASKPPWLLFRKSCEFYDPYERKSYQLDLPELKDSSLIHSKDGWLVMSNVNTLSLFLFCPYTRGLVKLPFLSPARRLMALSAAPTSPSCVLFSVDYVDSRTTRITTWRPGETEWNQVDYQNGMYCLYILWDKLLFCNGLFYCFSFTDEMGIYNSNESSWSVQSVTFPVFYTNWCKNLFLAEHDGDIIATYTFSTGRCTIINKLDRTNKMWVEMETLGGSSLFISDLSTHSRSDLLGNMRNNVYFPQVHLDGELCRYSLDRGRYFPINESSEWKGRDRLDKIWIDAPEELSRVLKTISYACQ